MNQDPIRITNRLRTAQGHSRARLYLLHHVGRVELYRREPGREREFDYAAVRGRFTAHGATPAEALAGVRALLDQQHASRQQPYSWRDGLELGYHSPCLYRFCQDYGLEPSAQLTRQDLLDLVAPPGSSLHRQVYIRALRRLGIHLK